MLRGMENTPIATTAGPPTARPNRLAAALLADRHSVPLSIALHLVPGALVVVAYLLVAEPFV